MTPKKIPSIENDKKKHSGKILQFACDCVSHLHQVIRDPWSYVSQAGFISSETKEIILNKTYREPQTVTQLSRTIGLSQPAIFKHVKELVTSDLLREVQLPAKGKAYRVEKYYEPNFPVLLHEDVAQLEPICQKVAERLADVYQEHRVEIEAAFSGCSLKQRGYQHEDILDYLYSKIRRLAREQLETRGFFPPLPSHPDGSRWVYWAEEVPLTENDAE